MGKQPSLLLLAALFWITIASTSALTCYECNMYMCTRPEMNTEQCQLARQYRQETNFTKRDDIFHKMVELAGCHENQVQNCKACVKVKTTIRRQLAKGEQIYDTVLSKVCAKEEPHTKYDLCSKSGPPFALQHVCHCFDDLCNSARHISTSFFLTLLSTVLALGQHMLFTQ